MCAGHRCHVDIGAIFDVMGVVEVICIGASVVDIPFIVVSADMLDTSILLFTPVMLLEKVSLDIWEDRLLPEEEESSPRPVPAVRM